MMEGYSPEAQWLADNLWDPRISFAHPAQRNHLKKKFAEMSETIQWSSINQSRYTLLGDDEYDGLMVVRPRLMEPVLQPVAWLLM